MFSKAEVFQTNALRVESEAVPKTVRGHNSIGTLDNVILRVPVAPSFFNGESKASESEAQGLDTVYTFSCIKNGQPVGD